MFFFFWFFFHFSPSAPWYGSSESQQGEIQPVERVQTQWMNSESDSEQVTHTHTHKRAGCFEVKPDSRLNWYLNVKLK